MHSHEYYILLNRIEELSVCSGSLSTGDIERMIRRADISDYEKEKLLDLLYDA